MSAEGRTRILVVDDEESVRQLVSRVLRDLGYEVDEAEDGLQALEKVAESRPDLMILDLMMPELDGWGVLEALGQRGGAPPVLLLTARSDYDTFARSVRDGAIAFVPKPFRLQELVGACRKILEAAARPPEKPESERRRGARRRFLVEVKVFSKGRAPIAFGEVANLGERGAQLDLDAPLQPGDEIRIAFNTPGEVPPLDLECEVLWWRGSSSRRVSHGLAFRNLSPDDERQLAELLGPPS